MQFKYTEIVLSIQLFMLLSCFHIFKPQNIHILVFFAVQAVLSSESNLVLH